MPGKSALFLFPLLIWAVFLVVPAGEGAQNMVMDGGFEMTAAGKGVFWIFRGEGASLAPGMGRGAGEAAEGAAAVTRPAADYTCEIIQPLLPLTAGRQYVLSAYVKNLAGTTGEAMIGLRQEKDFPRLFRDIPPGKWERLELAFTPDVGWAQVVLSGGAGVELVWDDVTLKESTILSEQLASEWEQRLKSGEKIYTGLVINAKGTGLQRGMSPKILDEFGRLIFKGVEASEVQLFSQGLVAYERDLDIAVKHPRLRVSDDYRLVLPLVVDAQKAVGYPNPNFPPTSVVVGAEDAKRIREAVAVYDFLERLAIVFVVD
ncbi:MAG TPA: hypothetical protein GXX29_04565 [Firmicutes bacterium]|nr:hypothetical protein [Bacillota bacterium]